MPKGVQISTFCGSMTRSKLKKHLKKCGVCGADSYLRSLSKL